MVLEESAAVYPAKRGRTAPKAYLCRHVCADPSAQKSVTLAVEIHAKIYLSFTFQVLFCSWLSGPSTDLTGPASLHRPNASVCFHLGAVNRVAR
jgi:hypothetical protein